MISSHAVCAITHNYGEIAYKNSVHILNSFLFLMCMHILPRNSVRMHACAVVLVVNVFGVCVCVRWIDQLKNHCMIFFHVLHKTWHEFHSLEFFHLGQRQYFVGHKQKPDREKRARYGRVNNGPFYYHTAYKISTFDWNTHTANWIGFSWIENDETRNFKILPFSCTLPSF